MKKRMWFLILVLIFLPMILFAQQDSTSVNPLPPASIWDVVMNFQTWIQSFPFMVVAVTFVAALLNGLLKVTKTFYRQLVAWGLMIAIVVVTDLVNIGYAKDLPIMIAVVHGLVGGLAANGFFDIPWCKQVLDRVEEWFVKPTN